MASNRKLPCSPFFIVVIAVILIMLIPLPAIVLCILIALNLVLAILIFFIALFSKKITDFSLFPTVLLASTIFGLAVNVFSARFIITVDDETIIQAVAALAAGSGGITHLIIGCAGSIVFAVFLIVIPKGAARVSEVAARFVLDSMQVKMMAVEAEYSSGLITEEEARKRNARILKESDFYGAMDGTVKFISGSIRIAIFIMMVIILRGTLFGVQLLLQGESFAGVTLTYILISIINGLYFLLQIFLLSVAACLNVSRSALEN
jgi:flagellar biosynthesis protein FlhA